MRLLDEKAEEAGLRAYYPFLKNGEKNESIDCLGTKCVASGTGTE